METTEPEHWGIMGGGILGMTLALRLRQAGKRVTLCESAPELGGLAAAWQLGDVTWDRHYHVILLSDTHLRSLLSELGLEHELEWRETKTGFYTDGKLYSMSNSVEFLKFPPLGLWSKLRLGATIFWASKLKNWRRLERIPVTTWLGRLSGRRTLEKIWLPLLRAKLGENYRKASAAFIWAIIRRMYAARRTGLKREMFGYVRGGYARILNRFGERLREAGVEVRVGQLVSEVSSQGASLRASEIDSHDRIRVTFSDGHVENFDRVVLTMPSPIAARLCPQLTAEERSRLNAIEYQGIICASLLLKEPLDRFYVTNITDSWVPFTAVIEMSTLVDRRELNGNCLVYLPKYVTPDDPAFGVSDEQHRETFLSALERMYPHFHRNDVLAFQVSRVRYVLAISTLNYSRSLPPMVTSVPGVAIVNSAHIVNGTLNVNETIQLAEEAMKVLLPAD
jgi:protoporphyrinogen oxidase